MKNNDALMSQLVMLLAGSGMSEDQLLRLLLQLKNASPDLLLEAVQEHRHITPPKLTRSIRYSYPVTEEPSRTRQIDQEVIDRIERLVVSEAGLPKSIASRLIVDILRKRNPRTVFPKFDSKRGFGKWLIQVAEKVSLGELMHAVAVLRNEVVHSPKDGWIIR